MSIFYPLCSSSKGNASYIGNERSGILVDAGLSLRAFKTALSLRGIDPRAIHGIFITHEHSDHIKGLYSIAQHLGVPVYGSCETLEWLIAHGHIPPKATVIEIRRRTACLADLEVRAFSTPHDSAHSLGYRITLPHGKAACLCTDLGHVTDEVYANLIGSDFVLLESNYEEEMLWGGPYPAFLKHRIASKEGHLSNADCAETLLRLFGEGCTHFMLGHLSETNNLPELAMLRSLDLLSKTGAVIGEDYILSVARVKNTGEAEII